MKCFKKGPKMLNFIFKKKTNLNLNIVSIFRNNENYLYNHYLPNIELLEKKSNDIKLFFYTNGNHDNTTSILADFCKNRKNAFLKTSEKKSELFARDTSFKRVQNIVDARNQLLKLRPFTNEYTIIIDSDIYFDVHVLERLVKKIDPNYSALFANGIDQNYLIETKKIHYYDVLAFIDMFNNYGYERFIENGHSENPFFELNDKISWKKGEITPVKSAFGGMGIYRSEILNKFVKYECIKTTKLMKNKQKIYTEHWSLNFYARQFGTLGIDPMAKVYHHSF